ncbi:rod shape-determining protein RodA [Caldalkalibacillus uzonensis]|uniref:Peptidoglycan glycosyltransferase RodA n=1 Tax=Caldalkalibacillus uzonensis TaxID=353224 RepID=A0ABU0CV05_9BACI|nr:rod shape-determining protein RodA [Caldalkalibacillus uzonensis]MDQ0339736.1 rod shape-determining protein RodA [Caldalkalibacillus uzonensis]
MTKEKSVWQRLDYGLLFLVFLLSLCSFIAIYSATNVSEEYGTYHFLIRQMIWYAFGFAVLLVMLLFDYRQLRHLSIPFYVTGIILLLLVMQFGEEAKGAQRWITIFNFNLQPSEFMKIFLIIAIAHFLVREQAKTLKASFKQDLWLTVKVGLITIVPFFLILKQPDLGTSLVLVAIMGTMVLAAGISWRVIFLMATAFVAIITGLVFLYFVNFDLFSKFIASHQLSRIYGWLDPYSSPGQFGYQLIQALMAIGSGQLMGTGFNQGVQARGYIPEVHTDFIFAVIGEEFGFIGASVLIAIYFILIYRLVQIALTCNDLFGSYLVAGIIGMLVFQVFQNIGMTIGLMPITGLALPFISYGGSALLTNMIAIGIVLNVHMRTKTYMFD